ncbi:MAG: hypothetical protein IJ184_06770 [Alphaproteobacteria bacterium]|nr:hypothetical protein [Alphaproteobacteria bacterium]
MTKHRRHKTHLPAKFLFETPEENLIAGILRQAWCDAFAGKVENIYAQEHRNRDRKEAVKMFEADCENEWRKSLAYLTDAIQIDEFLLVEGYFKYKGLIQATGKKRPKPAEAFDALLKILMTRKGDTNE